MSSRCKWTKEQEEQIKFLREREEVESWKEIAKTLNSSFPELNVSGKQCRQRYINYLRFDSENFKSPTWTVEDDSQFTNLFLEHGAKWAMIVQLMPGRSQNCLKNRYYGGLRRIIRKINVVEKLHRIRKTKPTKYETLIRILNCEYTEDGEDSILSQDVQSFSFFLRNLKINILETTWDFLNGKEVEERIVGLVREIHQFNTIFKTISLRGSSGTQKQKRKIAKLREENFKKEDDSVHELKNPQKVEQSEDILRSTHIFDCLELDRDGMNGQQDSQESSEFIIPREMDQIQPNFERQSTDIDLDFIVSQILQQDYNPQKFQYSI